MTRLRASLLLFAVLMISAPTFGGVYEDIYRGLGYMATPSGSPVSSVAGGGQANGSRFGRLRIVPNDYGDGHRLEFDRTFGGDSRGRPETFDIGAMELTLNGSLSSTVQYTQRLNPTLNVDGFASNLSYFLENKTGAQDFSLTGTINVNHQLEVNRLGFYYLDLEINHTNAEMTADGVIVDGIEDSDFDVGPISIRGNIFVDIAAAALNSIGLDSSGLESIFPESPIARINDELNAYIEQQRQVLGEAINADGDLSTADALTARDFVDGMMSQIAPESAQGPFGNVPESATLVLVGALTLMAAQRRRF